MIYQCEHCGDVVSDLSEYETASNGWWCDCNDFGGQGYFNFFNPKSKPRLQIYLESATHGLAVKDLPKNNDVKSQLSLFRYPGGKSKLAKYLATQIRPGFNQYLISPFTGGGSVELSLLESGIVQNLVLNDLDPLIYNVYDCALNHSHELINRLMNLHVDYDIYAYAKRVVLHQEIESDNIKRAILTLINNRCSYSGIYNAGPLGGKHGRREQLVSRFNVRKLIKSIQIMSKFHSHIQLYNCDAQTILHEYNYEHSTIYIDPPYVQKGPKLYDFAYTNVEQHYQLLFDVEENFEELPLNDIWLFYDDDATIRDNLIQDPIYLKRQFSI